MQQIYKGFHLTVLLLLAGAACMEGNAQDNTKEDTMRKERSDTMQLGKVVIIKKTDNDGETIIINKEKDKEEEDRKKKRRNVSSRWGMLDIGFANYTDRTNYTQAAADGFTDAGVGKGQLNLRNGKSVNVNIWFLSQQFSLVRRYLNLKYALGIELNNYRFSEPLLFRTVPTYLTTDPARHYRKNKLAADYVTLPLLLNLDLNPRNKRSLSISAGMSAGYLYSSRQKTITTENGKQKEKDDFDLHPFKFAYIGEARLGPVTLYGSLATKSMFEKGLDLTPYAFGVRFRGDRP